MTARKPAVVKAWNKFNGFDSTDDFWDRPSPMFRFAFEAGQADGWDEGFRHGSDYGHRHSQRMGAMPQPNPYKANR